MNPIKYLYCRITSHDISEHDEDVVCLLKYGNYMWSKCMRCGHPIKLTHEPDCKEDEYYEKEM